MIIIMMMIPAIACQPCDDGTVTRAQSLLNLKMPVMPVRTRKCKNEMFTFEINSENALVG
jgi:hypothetical protein